MKINVKDFRAQEGEQVKLQKWPTLVTPVYKSKQQYQERLAEIKVCGQLRNLGS